MSLINKVLHDLDRRSGFVAPGGGLPLQQVRPVIQRRAARLWSRVVLALVMLAGAARIGWIANQLRPHPPLATALAFRAEAEARARPAPVPQAPEPAPVAVAADEPPEAAIIEAEGLGDAAADSQPPAQTEGLKLALAIETPIPERKPRVARPVATRPAPLPRTVEATASTVPTPALSATALARVERRERSSTTAEQADSQFNSAMRLLNEGRIAEAESALGAVLAANPKDERARQAFVALLLEQRRLEEAVLVLRQGIALDPAKTQFSLVLARVLAERKDYSGALEVLTRAQPGGRNPEFSNLLAAVLQRLGRHREAAEAYRAALEASPGNASALMGLAISLENLQERSEALEAYRRALASESITADLRAFAEQKVKELR
jgi:MSHA biogenesis protein MshN